MFRFVVGAVKQAASAFKDPKNLESVRKAGSYVGDKMIPPTLNTLAYIGYTRKGQQDEEEKRMEAEREKERASIARKQAHYLNTMVDTLGRIETGVKEIIASAEKKREENKSGPVQAAD